MYLCDKYVADDISGSGSDTGVGDKYANFPFDFFPLDFLMHSCIHVFVELSEISEFKIAKD